MAQFEIAPDHFDTPTIQQVSPAGTIATANQRAGGFQGQCTLLHEVSYAGVTLPPGTYSLSIRPHGSWDLVTLALKGSDAKIQAHVKASIRRWSSNRADPRKQWPAAHVDRHFLAAAKLAEKWPHQR